METLERPLPSDEMAEQIVLGSVFLDEKLFDLAKDRLSPKDFYNPFHRRVFEGIQALYESDTGIDAVALNEWWVKIYSPQGALSRITGLVSGLPLVREKEYENQVTRVKKHAVTRQLLFLTTKVQRDLLDGETDIEEVAKDVESSLAQMNNQMLGVRHEDKPFVNLIELRDPMLEQFAKYNRGEFTGVRSGMKELDDKLDGGGFQPKGLYLLGAGEKAGKTSLVLDWAYDVASVQHHTVPFITMEMGAVTLAKRLFSKHTGIPYHLFRPGFRGEMYERAIEEMEGFTKIPIIIADSIYGLAQIIHFLRREVEIGLKKNKPVGMAVVDYLQIISLDMKTQSREREVSTISRKLKQLATDLDIPLVVISNLNRLGLTEGQEPDTFNLRDSGSLAFDAEAVLFLHNPAYVPGKPYEPREVTDINLIISRQRNGPAGRIKLKMLGKYMQFMTESEYNRVFGPSESDKPELKSKGQLMLEEKKVLDLWDEEEDDDF